MVHSKKIDETAIWKEYEKKADAGSERCIWVKDVYEYAANYWMPWVDCWEIRLVISL